MAEVGRTAPVPIRRAHSPGPTGAIAAAASQRHNRPEPRPRPTARPASPLYDGGSGGVASLPSGKCSPKFVSLRQLDDVLNYISHNERRALVPPLCVTRQVVGSHVGCAVPSPPPPGWPGEEGGRRTEGAEALLTPLPPPFWIQPGGRASAPPTRGLPLLSKSL